MKKFEEMSFKEKAELLSRYPVRTCKSNHNCRLCPNDIELGHDYHDGGFGKRAHIRCVDLLLGPI